LNRNSEIKVVRKKLRKARGYCYMFPPKIEIDSRLEGLEELEVYIHEFTHHIQPYLDEDTVDKIGKDMSEFLFKHGYRKLNSK